MLESIDHLLSTLALGLLLAFAWYTLGRHGPPSGGARA